MNVHTAEHCIGYSKLKIWNNLKHVSIALSIVKNLYIIESKYNRICWGLIGVPITIKNGCIGKFLFF